MANKSISIYGSYNDLLDQFTELMEQITGKNVELECSLQGELTVNFENTESRPAMDLDVIYRNADEKTLEYLRAPHPDFLDSLSETDYQKWAEIANQIETENN